MTLKKKIFGYSVLVGITLVYVGIVLPVQNIYFKRIQKHRTELNYFVKNSEDTPLEKEQISSFKQLKYFPIDKQFKKEAGVEWFKNSDTLEFNVFGSEKSDVESFIRCGKVIFQHEKKIFGLEFYKHLDDKAKKSFFVPYYDLSNTALTYRNGRYLYFEIDTTKVIQTIDFNLSYNPFCAYNKYYKCPLPPKSNFLPFIVDAGEKKF